MRKSCAGSVVGMLVAVSGAVVGPAVAVAGVGAVEVLVAGVAAAQQAPGDELRADFDGDGFDDLAIAAPAESVGAVEGGGAVTVVYGSADGLSGAGSQVLTQDVAGIGSTVEALDNFGAALATGDFDADGFDDLAVGVDREAVGAASEAGAVNVLYGSASGLSGAGSQLFTQDVAGIGSTVEAFDHFGAELTTGDVDDDGVTDLAVGVPYEAVGTVTQAGAVNVIYGSPSQGLTGTGSQLLTQDTAGIGSTAERYDVFGWTLASGDFDGDGPDDLAVGVLSEDVGTVEDGGAVNVVYGTPAGLSAAGTQVLTQDVPGIGSTVEFHDYFGATLAAGDFDGDAAGTSDLAVGAVQESVGTVFGAGAVNVIYGSSPAGLSGAGSQVFTQDVPGIEGDVDSLDVFGGALAAGDYDGDGIGDLVVGSPSEVDLLAAGTANVLFGSSPAGLSGLGSQLISQDTGVVEDTAEEGDRFGEHLTTGDYDGDGVVDLAVGVPDEDLGDIVDAGVVDVVFGGPDGLPGARAQFVTQETPGVPSTSEPFDGWGESVA